MNLQLQDHRDESIVIVSVIDVEIKDGIQYTKD